MPSRVEKTNGRRQKKQLQNKGELVRPPFLVSAATRYLRGSARFIRFLRSFLFSGKTRRRSASFGHNLVFVNRPQLLDPCRGLISFASMAFVQTEQLERPSKREEDDRGSE